MKYQMKWIPLVFVVSTCGIAFANESQNHNLSQNQNKDEYSNQGSTSDSNAESASGSDSSYKQDHKAARTTPKRMSHNKKSTASGKMDSGEEPQGIATDNTTGDTSMSNMSGTDKPNADEVAKMAKEEDAAKRMKGKKAKKKSKHDARMKDESSMNAPKGNMQPAALHAVPVDSPSHDVTGTLHPLDPMNEDGGGAMETTPPAATDRYGSAATGSNPSPSVVGKAAKSDAEIQAEVRQELMDNSTGFIPNPEDVKVKSEDNVVVLEGKVRSKFEEDLVLQKARSVAGVSGVVNKLEIEPGE